MIYLFISCFHLSSSYSQLTTLKILHVRKYQEGRDSNPGQVGERLVSSLYAMPSPRSISVAEVKIHLLIICSNTTVFEYKVPNQVRYGSSVFSTPTHHTKQDPFYFITGCQDQTSTAKREARRSPLCYTSPLLNGSWFDPRNT